MIPKFSKASIAKLAVCHSDLIKLFTQVIRYYDCTIVDSYRTKDEQEKAFKAGLSEVHYPSYHNCQPCFAVDVAPYQNNHIEWNLKQCMYFNAFVMGIAEMMFDQEIITHKIITGADWDSDHDIMDTKFIDATHFYIMPLPGEKMNFVSGT
jgi:hypothetical protein